MAAEGSDLSSTAAANRNLETSCSYFGPFYLNHRTRELRRDGELLPITPKAFDLLQILVTHADRVMSKTELMTSVWPDSFVGEDSLAQNIALLRKVLGDSTDHPHYIATVHRRGYRFIASVRSSPEQESPLPPAQPVNGHHTDVPEPTAAPSAARPGWNSSARLVLMVAVPVLCLLALAITYARREEHSAGSVSFSIHPPDDGKIASGGLLSPDGTRIAFITSDASGARKLWVRSIDSVDAVSLPGTDGAKLPFWSPDSRRLGFFANGLLMTVEIGGGFPQTVVPVSTAPTGGTWNEDDIILFASRRSGLFQVPAAGGIPTPLTVLDSALRETSHNWPQFLPDGRHFLYTIRSANTALNGVYVGSLDDPTLKRQVLETTSGSVYAGGRIFFVREGALRSQAFDTATLRTTGPSEFVAPNVPVPDGAFGMTFSAVNVGFTYLSPSPPRRQTWFDRSGKELGTLESTAVLSRVALSPDEQHVAGSDHSSPTYGIWLFDLARGTAFRLAANGDNAVWSPDGNDIYFVSSQASGILDVYRKPAYGPDQAELILSNGQSMWPVDISADGRYLVYTSDHSKSQLDLWVLPLFGDRTPFPYLNTPANEIQGRPSPDGRWMAYTSDETGRWEVYLQTFPMAGGKRRVSVAGGAQPFWRRDGRELFYLSLDRKLMSVEIRDNGTLHIGHAKPLFQTRTRDDLTAIRNDYTVTADGNRFLIESQAEAKSQTITVVINQLPTFDE